MGDSLFGGPDEAYREEVLNFIAQQGLSGRVRWLGARSDAVDILAQSDVAVMNSLWPEGFGLVAAEAMWAGVPLVGTALGGMSELLIDGRTGVVVEPGNIDQLAEAIAALLEDPQRRLRLAEAARSHISALQSDQNVRHLENLLEQSLHATVH